MRWWGRRRKRLTDDDVREYWCPTLRRMVWCPGPCPDGQEHLVRMTRIGGEAHGEARYVPGRAG